MEITFLNNPITLKNTPIKVGDKMPEFTVRRNDLSDINLSSLDKATLFIVVPSIDTDVCDLEIQRFSKDLEGVENVKVYGVSMDLPFAQSRWCGVKAAANVELVSDYVSHSFGLNTGTYIEGIGLLTRAIILVDENQVVRYVEYVKEVTDQPDYAKALEAVKSI